MRKNITHLMIYGKFTEDYINFINKYYGSDHVFYILGRGLNLINLKCNENIVIYNKLTLARLIKILVSFYKSKKVILHSLFFSPKIILFILFFYWRKRNIHIYFWGADIYNRYNATDKTKIDLHVNRIYSLFILSTGYTINIIKEDYHELKKYVNHKHGCIIALYHDENLIKYINDNQSHRYTKGVNESTNILVGNSSSITNLHIDAYEKLSIYKNENIKVYSFLSYGDMNYRNSVIESGMQLFGNRYNPITDYFDKQKFVNLYKTMDIAIFNNVRQEALFNIYTALALGVKVFLKFEGNMWLHFTRAGYDVYAIEDMINMKFLNFIEFTDKMKNMKIALDFLEVKNRKKEWDEVFLSKNKCREGNINE